MVYQASDESGAPLQADYKNLKLSELSRSRLRFEYETVDLLPKVEVASSSLVTRSSLHFRADFEYVFGPLSPV
jgi:hypothetical protein